MLNFKKYKAFAWACFLCGADTAQGNYLPVLCPHKTILAKGLKIVGIKNKPFRLSQRVCFFMKYEKTILQFLLRRIYLRVCAMLWVDHHQHHQCQRHHLRQPNVFYLRLRAICCHHDLFCVPKDLLR
jgi:hypothetical protein